jgi:lactate dehydrogenase-like 2-hydroxyacid dehydrogenase
MIFKILICDLIGLKFGADGKPDPSEVKAHILTRGGVFHLGGIVENAAYENNRLHFFYLPDLSTEAEILAVTALGQFDAVIAAATFLPKASVFNLGGVRMGAGTGNMGSASWGGGNGMGGVAPLMNTPGFNSRATAQMTFKALLRVRPDLPVDELHRLSVDGAFDTGKNLRDYPTEKLEGQTMAILGYGNIGREVAKLAQAFGMNVKVYARVHHQARIEADGFIYAASAIDAARQADVVSVHTGLGAFDAASGKFANAGIINAEILDTLKPKSVLLNYDRGECVDVAALDAAMASGQVQYAAIDADIFKAADGSLSGPLLPYLPLAKKYPGRLSLLPHAAADTDHPSRVASAKQAVDQIFDCILNRRVTNLKGDLPPGYVNAGVKLGTADKDAG